MTTWRKFHRSALRVTDLNAFSLFSAHHVYTAAFHLQLLNQFTRVNTAPRMEHDVKQNFFKG